MRHLKPIHHRHNTRPFGQPTRGKTALNRLRRIDIFTALALENTLVSGMPLVVDLGYGAYPWTALEMANRLRFINPNLRLLGVEIDLARVEAAIPYANPPLIDFRLGGFNLMSMLGGERARLIRAYNVLRQYDESAVLPALIEMAAALEPGGVLIEGTCNPSGRLAVFDVYRKMEHDLNHESLVFAVNFRTRVTPEAFRAILPKRLIHHAHDPVLDSFFTAWTRGYMPWGADDLPIQRGWIEAGRSLRHEYPVDGRMGLLRRGFLTLRTPLLPWR